MKGKEEMRVNDNKVKAIRFTFEVKRINGLSTIPKPPAAICGRKRE